MTFETHLVNEYIARKMLEKRNSDLKLIVNIVTYTAITLVVLTILEAMLIVS
jgi:hypothetical protein